MGCCNESSVAVVGRSFACACAVGSGGPRCAAAVCPALSFDAEGGTVVSLIHFSFAVLPPLHIRKLPNRIISGTAGAN